MHPAGITGGLPHPLSGKSSRGFGRRLTDPRRYSITWCLDDAKSRCPRRVECAERPIRLRERLSALTARCRAVRDAGRRLVVASARPLSAGKYGPREALLLHAGLLLTEEAARELVATLDAWLAELAGLVAGHMT